MQAVLASDFSIAQFAFLERLLLVHGHSNYFRCARVLCVCVCVCVCRLAKLMFYLLDGRTSKLILYFLYKSVLLH